MLLNPQNLRSYRIFLLSRNVELAFNNIVENFYSDNVDEEIYPVIDIALIGKDQMIFEEIGKNHSKTIIMPSGEERDILKVKLGNSKKKYFNNTQLYNIKTMKQNFNLLKGPN